VLSLRVVDGGRKGVRPELLPRASTSPTSVGTPKPLSKGVSDIKFVCFSSLC